MLINNPGNPTIRAIKNAISHKNHSKRESRRLPPQFQLLQSALFKIGLLHSILSNPSFRILPVLAAASDLFKSGLLWAAPWWKPADSTLFAYT